MSMELSFVKNEKKYHNFIRELRNMNYRNGFDTDSFITPEMQDIYMGIHNDSYYIALANGEPIGFVGVVDDDIRIATLPNFCNRGVGVYMLNEIMKIFPTAKAKIKGENDASLNLFKKVGFKIKYYLLER
jgi:ribosomal protein S18 acetylase RimI-like enzyme